MTEFTEWNNFYVIVGSAAGALIGLQFVVMTLIADMSSARVDTQTGGAFATPSVVHFGVVLLLSAVLSAPWHQIDVIAIFWGLTGLSGIAYGIVVTRRLRLQKAYEPVIEDWLFHVVFPFAAYTALTVSSYAAYLYLHTALFLVGAASLMLLFIGIHNAWDAVTYHVFVNKKKQDGDEQHRSAGEQSPKLEEQKKIE